MAHYALPHLKRAQGAIVNIGSKTAVTGQGRHFRLRVVERRGHGATREWAAELLRLTTSAVNTISAGGSDDPASTGSGWPRFQIPRKSSAPSFPKIPLGKRMTTAGEIAAMAIFLLSGKSGHTTGQHIFVDGGYSHLDRALT